MPRQLDAEEGTGWPLGRVAPLCERWPLPVEAREVTAYNEQMTARGVGLPG